MENYEQNDDPRSVAEMVSEAFTQHIEAFAQSDATGTSDDQDDLDDFWDNVPI